MSQPFIEFQGISKAFAGVQALSGVSLDIRRGECLGLMGENGAGKSTLGKVLAGVHRADSGRVMIEGAERRFHSPADALRAGVGMVHQELAFCPDLTIAENLCLSGYPRRAGVFVDRRAMIARARELLAQIGVEMDVTRLNRELTTAQEQLVQIAAAVGTGGGGIGGAIGGAIGGEGGSGRGAKVIVFDEPTSSLSEPEARRLFALIGELKARGVTVVYVSHRMPEVVRLCDRVAVLRDGQLVGTLTKEEISEDRVVRMMVGRSVGAFRPGFLEKPAGEARLEVRGLSSAGKFSDISFAVRAGEIVGFAGLVGSGRSEVAQAIFGLDGRATGEVWVEGTPMRLHDIRLAKRRGLSLLPEDRKKQGLVLGMSCATNMTMAILDRLGRLRFPGWAGFLGRRRERELTAKYFAELSIKAAGPEAAVGSLSGGNQQKVALGKWLALEGKVLIVDEPTRGVDVGAKAAIHAILDDLAKGGLAILLISSELPELLALSARVLVMREGRLVGELGREEANEEAVMRAMAGVGG